MLDGLHSYIESSTLIRANKAIRFPRFSTHQNFRFFADNSSFPDFNACLMTPTVSTLSSSSFSLKWKIGFNSSFLIRLLIFDFFIFREGNKVFLDRYFHFYAFKTKPLETMISNVIRECENIFVRQDSYWRLHKSASWLCNELQMYLYEDIIKLFDWIVLIPFKPNLCCCCLCLSIRI